MALVRRIYDVSSRFPADERFGLTAQVRRSAVSVPSNIAEGAARGTRKEFVQFLTAARGSLSELDTQVRIAGDLGFAADIAPTIESIERLFSLLAAEADPLRAAKPRPQEAAQRPISRT
jgi:four helix bundle protein